MITAWGEPAVRFFFGGEKFTKRFPVPACVFVFLGNLLDHGFINHWFPLIRPAIKPLFRFGGYVRGGRVD